MKLIYSTSVLQGRDMHGLLAVVARSYPKGRFAVSSESNTSIVFSD
jgi:hypothetical protein